MSATSANSGPCPQVLATIEHAEKSEPIVKTEQQKATFSAQRAVYLLWTHFIESYSNVEVVQWSLWWSVTMGGYMQVSCGFFFVCRVMRLLITNTVYKYGE